MNNRRFHRVLVATVLFGCSQALAIISPPTAMAAGCTGSSCNGKSPTVMGCSADAVTVNSVVDEDHASGGTFGRQVVQLRYSRSCNAFWSRATATAGGTARVTSTVAYMDGFKVSTNRSRLGPGSVASKMRSGLAINSCGRTVFSDGAVVKRNCAHVAV